MRMTATLTPRTEVLPSAQRQLWPALRPLAGLGFALYGGTAIALRLGHRISVDFDFFSEQALDREALRDALAFLVKATVLQDRANTLTVSVPSGDSGAEPVKLSFVGTIGFGRVGTPDTTADGVLQVASLDDLMATKLKVILQRAEAKDYRDIAAMLGAGVNFADGDLPLLTQAEKSCLVKAASSVRDLPEVPLLARQLTAAS